VPLAEVEAAVTRQARRGTLVEAEVDGWPGRWLVAAAAAARVR
jgi:hypothetical protein